MAGSYCYRDVLSFSIMVVMECVNVGLNTLVKAATLKGMSYHVFVVYAYALVLLPSPFISRRSRVLPPLTFQIMCKIGLLGFIGSSSQIMGYTGHEGIRTRRDPQSITVHQLLLLLLAILLLFLPSCLP